MARTTKKKKTSSRAKSARPAAKKKPTRKKAPAKAATRAKPSRSAKRGKGETEVERHWRDYQQCRSELETAVSAGRDAEQTLASARELERSRREVFDRKKQTLMGLLEVEPASASGPSPALLDFSPSDFGDIEPGKSSVK